MLYTSSLLKRYLSLTVDIEEIARELTLKTCEVEEIHARHIPDLVVIGKVTEKTQHPDADKLSVCQVDCGSKGTFQICCGATNVDKDMYIAAALPGCFLPAINLQIEPREMRGQASNGMICSKEELGIPEDLEEKWIWILQSIPTSPVGDFDDITDAHLGTSLTEQYPRLETWTMDVDNKTITHRPDLFGHFGIATELETIFPDKVSFSGGKQRRTALRETNIFELLDQAKQSDIALSVTSEKVESYILLELHNTQRTKSDLYLRSILYDLGMQPKANRVDFSNMFMYLTGQPIHFFDGAKIEGGIIVRQARNGEIFTDLFEQSHVLTEDDIVISDNKKIIALAGIVGSNNSGIDETTKNIIVEIANFNDVQVRKTAMRLGLRTDAEVRFEKQINPLYSLHVLPMLLDELEYYTKSLGAYDIGGLQRWVHPNSSLQVKNMLSLDTLAVERMLFGGDGTQVHITDNEIAGILQSLGCTITKDRDVSIPIWRGPSDIEQSIDLIEEIARIYGYDNIPELAYTHASGFTSFSSEIQQQRSLEELLTGRFHYDQIETYPWIHERRITYAEIPTEGLLSMKDISSAEQQYLRNTMVWSLLEAIEKNAHFTDSGRIFDIGKTRDQDRDTIEHSELILGMWTKKYDTRNQEPYLHLRAHIDAVFKALGVKGKIDINASSLTWGHPKQQATISVNTVPVATLATLHPSLTQYVKLPSATKAVIAQIDLSALQQYIPTKKKKKSTYISLQDQIIEKDLNFVIDTETVFGDVVEAIQKVREISSIEVFDVYTGEHLPENKKSIALRITMQTRADETPYTPDDITSIMNKSIAAAEKVGAILR